MTDTTSYRQSAKNDWLRRNLTLAAITILKRSRPRQSSVLFLTRRICVKYGPLQHLSGAAAMQFIASNTSIPVPKVYCAFERKGITYIVMSRLAGSPIGQNWSRRSDQSKTRLLEQLRNYIQEMRILKPTSGKVEGVNSSKLYDMRIPGGIHGFGPFDTIRDFHSFLTSGIKMSPDQFPEVNELIMMYEDSQYTTRFTHGDLSSANILVERDKVVGIVDWDTCGWYPEYWEYTTAWNVNPYNEFWRGEVGKFVQEYPEALKMEEIRQKYFGDF
jgi:Phosphotransferase enzyme family